jgi:hypothetical protein
MKKTNWRQYGPEKNPRCANCMVHSGFEASALSAIKHSPSSLWRISGGFNYNSLKKISPDKEQ